MRELSGKLINVIDVQILELLRIVYRAFSNNGENPNNGLDKLVEIKNFLYNKIYELKGIKIRYIHTEYKDYLNAIDLINKHPKIFMRRGAKETVWPEIADAIIASKWIETKAMLYTKDSALVQFGRKMGLKYVMIKA